MCTPDINTRTIKSRNPDRHYYENYPTEVRRLSDAISLHRERRLRERLYDRSRDKITSVYTHFLTSNTEWTDSLVYKLATIGLLRHWRNEGTHPCCRLPPAARTDDLTNVGGSPGAKHALEAAACSGQRRCPPHAAATSCLVWLLVALQTFLPMDKCHLELLLSHHSVEILFTKSLSLSDVCMTSLKAKCHQCTCNGKGWLF